MPSTEISQATGRFRPTCRGPQRGGSGCGHPVRSRIPASRTGALCDVTRERSPSAARGVALQFVLLRGTRETPPAPRHLAPRAEQQPGGSRRRTGVKGTPRPPFRDLGVDHGIDVRIYATLSDIAGSGFHGQRSSPLWTSTWRDGSCFVPSCGQPEILSRPASTVDYRWRNPSLATGTLRGALTDMSQPELMDRRARGPRGSRGSRTKGVGGSRTEGFGGSRTEGFEGSRTEGS
jgi:hypothetical protein